MSIRSIAGKLDLKNVGLIVFAFLLIYGSIFFAILFVLSEKQATQATTVLLTALLLAITSSVVASIAVYLIQYILKGDFSKTLRDEMVELRKLYNECPPRYYCPALNDHDEIITREIKEGFEHSDFYYFQKITGESLVGQLLSFSSHVVKKGSYGKIRCMGILVAPTYLNYLYQAEQRLTMKNLADNDKGDLFNEYVEMCIDFFSAICALSSLYKDPATFERLNVTIYIFDCPFFDGFELFGNTMLYSRFGTAEHKAKKFPPTMLFPNDSTHYKFHLDRIKFLDDQGEKLPFHQRFQSHASSNNAEQTKKIIRRIFSDALESVPTDNKGKQYNKERFINFGKQKLGIKFNEKGAVSDNYLPDLEVLCDIATQRVKLWKKDFGI